jgi:hypothetical protein
MSGAQALNVLSKSRKCFIEVYIENQWIIVIIGKDDCKISVSFEQIQNFEVSNLAMAKVKKSQYKSYL